MKRSSRGYKMVEKAKAPPDKFAMNRNSPIAMKQEYSEMHVNKINQSQNILSIESHIPSSGYIELSPKKIQQFHNTQFLSDYKEPGNINNRKTKDTDFQSTDLRRGTRRLPRPWPEDVPPIRSGTKPVNSKKYKDLMTSLQWVPTIFHDYYKKLQHGAEIPEFPEVCSTNI